jgi:hypothetical protein
MKNFLFLLAGMVLLAAGAAFAVEKPRSGEELLREAYHRNLGGLTSNSFGLPLVLESVAREDQVHVDVYGILAHPFSSVVDALRVPVNWCDIVSIPPNVKACTYRELPGAYQLTFYLGRKVYQPPEDAHQVIYHYRNVAQRPGYLDIMLSADTGPFGTRDHRLRFEALPLDRGRTFVHVSYAYRDTAALRLAAKGYFATLGRDKVGFTVTGTDQNGKPVYIGGPRGAIERNAVRYYLAIQAFMSTMHYPAESRFSMRIGEWHDLSSRYPQQLFDLDRQDYLKFKTAEHEGQVTLQWSIGTGLH